MWTYITPQLAVPDVAEAQRYYHEVFDFEVGFQFGERFGAVYLGKTEIYFQRSEAAHSGSVSCVRVENADELYAIYKERGAKIVDDLGDKPWNMREFTVQDPWGHQFRIGHPTRS